VVLVRRLNQNGGRTNDNRRQSSEVIRLYTLYKIYEKKIFILNKYRKPYEECHKQTKTRKNWRSKAAHAMSLL
jgi:hypothetical protein